MVSVTVLMLICPLDSMACQIEYSDWLVNVFRQQGVSLDKRVGSYASLSECQAAMNQAVSQSGDPSLANNMSCVGCNQPAFVPPPSTHQQTSSPSPQAIQNGGAQDTGQAAAEEKARQEAFSREHQDLLRRLKGEKGFSSDLTLKTTIGAESGLKLKTGNRAVTANRPNPNDRIMEEVEAAQKRIAELKRKVSGIQTLLRQCTRSLVNNSAEFDRWGATVDESYNSVLANSKEYLLGLFVEYNLLGNLTKVQKDSFGELGRLVDSADPNIQNWLRKELGGRSVDPGRFEKLVKLGQGEGDFAGLLNTEDGLRKNLDALILVNDLLDVVGKGVPGGGAFQHARMIGETYADLSSISYSWFSINRLGKDTDKLTREVNSLSFQMRYAMKEMDCLDLCVATPAATCMDRCTGKTRFSTPPPMLR